MMKKLQKSIAIGYILGAALCFALMNLFVRLAGDLPVMQKVFFRNLIAMFVMFFVLLKDKEKFRIKKESFIWLFLRAAIGFLGVVLNFYAIDRLAISDASILNKLSPIFAIVFSAILLRERPNKVEILCVLITFAGALFVIKPSFSLEVIPALSGFLSGMCAGFAYTCVRILGNKGERSTITVFFFSAFSTVVALPFMIAFFEPMSAWQLTSLLLSGLSATGGQLFITAAYRKAPAKEIAVFDYFQVIFAAILGFCFLDQIPDLWSILGYVIIIGMAVVKWIYNLKVQTKPTAPEPPKDLSSTGSNEPPSDDKNTSQ